MFNRKDPLIDSVKNVMKENELRRDAERKLCEELGIASRKQLPREHLANYDALLEQKIAEALHPNQQKLDVHEPEKDKLTAQDFKMLRSMGKKKPTTEETITQDAKNPIPKTAAERIKGDAETAPKFANKPDDQSKLTDADKASMTDKVKEIMKEYAELDESVSATSYNDADGNKTWDVTHKKKKIGSITVNKKGSWSYEHEPSGNYEDGYDSKREAVKELKDTHKYHEKIMKDGTLEEASYSAKAARAGKDIGKPGKMFKKIASDAAKRYGSEERGKKVAGAVLAKLRSKNMEEHVEQIDELSRKTLHSYVNKSLDKVKSGEEPREKRQKGLRKATTKLYKVDEENIEEKAPSGAKFERMVKHIKKKYAKDGLTKQEKSIAYATAWKAKNKEEMKESIEAELKKNLGEKYNKIMEQEDDDLDKATKSVSSITAKPSTPDMSMKSAVTGRENVPGPNDGEPAKAPNVDIKAAQGTYSQLTGDQKPSSGMTPSTPKPAASTPAAKPAEPATPAPKAAAPAPKPAAPAPKAATPAPKPAAPAPKPTAPASQAPVGGPGAGEGDDSSSPLAATRQYNASKEAGAFDNKPAAPAAKPAARPAARQAAPMPPRRPAAPQRMASGGMMAESLEETIKKIIKE